MGKHASCSPSKLKRRLLCPGSRRVEELAPRREHQVSEAAQEGTMLHRTMEGVVERYFAGRGVVVPAGLTAEQERSVAVCGDWLSELFDTLDSNVVMYETETPTSLSYLDGIAYTVDGTADLVIDSLPTRIDVVDWKFGAGVPVVAEGNFQLLAYALGCFHSLEEVRQCESIVVHIAQPRLISFTTAHYTGPQLADWAETVLAPAVRLALTPDAPCYPGEEQCRWCATQYCPDYIMDKVRKGEEVLSAVERGVDLTQSTSVFNILEKAKEVKKFIDETMKHVAGELKAGRPYPGYKLVHGRNSRVWADAGKAEKYFYDYHILPSSDRLEEKDFFLRKMVTPAQAEKIVPKQAQTEQFKALIKTVPGRPTVAPETDKRPAIKESAEEAFKSLTV